MLCEQLLCHKSFSLNNFCDVSSGIREVQCQPWFESFGDAVVRIITSIFVLLKKKKKEKENSPNPGRAVPSGVREGVWRALQLPALGRVTPRRAAPVPMFLSVSGRLAGRRAHTGLSPGVTGLAQHPRHGQRPGSLRRVPTPPSCASCGEPPASSFTQRQRCVISRRCPQKSKALRVHAARESGRGGEPGERTAWVGSGPPVTTGASVSPRPPV